MRHRATSVIAFNAVNRSDAPAWLPRLLKDRRRLDRRLRAAQPAPADGATRCHDRRAARRAQRVQRGEQRGLHSVAAHLRLNDHYVRGVATGYMSYRDARAEAFLRDPVAALGCLAFARIADEAGCASRVLVSDSALAVDCARAVLAAMASSHSHARASPHVPTCQTPR